MGLLLILAWMYSTSELDELFLILNSIKGFKLRQPQWSNTTLPKSNSGDNSSKSRHVQKLRRRLNYAFQKATKVANQQANKYKSSYDKSIKGPQLEEKDINYKTSGNQRNM